MGDKVGSTGEVTVEGNASTWTTNYEVVVGNSGSGELNVTDGGRVRHSLLYIGEKSGSIGKITVDGIPDHGWKVGVFTSETPALVR